MVEAQGLAGRYSSRSTHFCRNWRRSRTPAWRLRKILPSYGQTCRLWKRVFAATGQRAGSESGVRQFIGDGQRQYLSGMFLGGQRILVLMDVRRMLDNALVNIIRTRNMDDDRKRNAQNGRGSSKRWTGSRRSCQLQSLSGMALQSGPQQRA